MRSHELRSNKRIRSRAGIGLVIFLITATGLGLSELLHIGSDDLVVSDSGWRAALFCGLL